jgi:hypothetical protein
MKLSKKAIGKKIDELVKLKQKMATLADREAELVTVIKTAGGGKSASYCANLVKVRAHWVYVKSHRRLVLVDNIDV